jgi:(5-formylfuran-3-yl)methyl phosphate synthase
MTLMLATVVDAVEARIAFDGGADVIDFSDPGRGALGAVAVETIAAAVATIGRPRAISAALALPCDPDTLKTLAQALSAAGVDTLRLAAQADTLGRLNATLSALAQEISLVGVLFADLDPDFGTLGRLAGIGFRGALLDAGEKGGKRLLDHLPPPRIEAFCRRCRDLGLAAWLAGSLQSPDVPRLLIVEPDVLGFRSALCLRGRRDGPLDPRRVALIRDLIPRVPSPGVPSPGSPSGDGRLNKRLTGRGEGVRSSNLGDHALLSAHPSFDLLHDPLSRPVVEVLGEGAAAGVGDTIFVHDFLTMAEVGAYAHERGARQRLLFNIDVTVSRVAAHADDMRAVVSYDVILDAVRIVVGRGHIDFIETVAEEVAAIVLKHRRVQKVRVRVEKLDVVAGSVGVEIVRVR